MNAIPRLKLRAEDQADLVILSTHAQDMVLRVGDIAYLAKARRFALMGQRFQWEASADRSMRVRAALRVETVLAVRAQGFNPTDSDLVLNLLEIKAHETAALAVIDFIFSDNKSLRLEAEALDLWLEDVGAPYPARGVPDHAVDLDADAQPGDGLKE
jgi:hypothetical protein